MHARFFAVADRAWQWRIEQRIGVEVKAYYSFFLDEKLPIHYTSARTEDTFVCCLRCE